MAGRRLAIPSKQLQLRLVGARDSFKASRVQRVSLTTDIPSEYKDELGNPLHVGNTKDTPNATVTFSAFDVGIKVVSALAGVDASNFPASGVDIAQLGSVDVILDVKDATVADYVKSIHGRRLQVSQFAFNYAVDQDSTEDYTLVGSERRYLKYDVIVDKFTSGGTSFTLSQTPIQLLNGRYVLSVILDGTYLKEVTGTPATGEYKVVGTTLTTYDTLVTQAIVVYHANPAGNNWADISDASMPASVRGKDVHISIAANGIDRVQSVTINGNLNTTAVKELGTREVVGYQTQIPQVEGTIAVLDTDTDLVSLLTTGTIGSGEEWLPGEGCSDVALALKIEIGEPCDDTTAVVHKTVYIPDITIVGDAFSSTVNQNATQNFNWRSANAQCIIYSGAI